MKKLKWVFDKLLSLGEFIWVLFLVFLAALFLVFSAAAYIIGSIRISDFAIERFF